MLGAIATMKRVIELKRKFDIEIWLSGPFSEEDPKPTCGTTACAAGWMGLDPYHQAEGLRLIGPSECPTPTYRSFPAFAGLQAYFIDNEHGLCGYQRTDGLAEQIYSIFFASAYRTPQNRPMGSLYITPHMVLARMHDVFDPFIREAKA